MADDVDWTQFPITITFDRPQKLVGRLLAVVPVDTREGTVLPRLHLRLRDGSLAIVTASQASLRRALHDVRPRIGQVVTIEYLGEAKRAAPGMSPAKAFDVTVAKEEANK